MDIEKVKNYNQKMLAAFFTMAVIAAGIGIVSILIFIISELIPDRRPTQNILLSDKKIDELKKDSLRQQIISYDTPRLVDTLNLIYLIPVSVKTLDKPEKMEFNLQSEKDDYYDGGSSSYKRNPRMKYYGAFNNLIIYDYKNSITKKVCDYRLIGEDLLIEYFKDEIVMAFLGSEKDTDGDNVITLQDFKSLFLYSLNTKVLKKVSMNNQTVTSFSYVQDTKDLLVTFGFDKNKDNKFNDYFEPTVVMRYDYASGRLTPIVNKDLEKDIQRIIDKN